MQEKKLKDLIRSMPLVEAPTTTRRFCKHFEFIIGIGENETATITMSEEAMKELSRLTKDYNN